MAATAAQARIPAFAQRLLGKSDDERMAVLSQEHPDYASHKTSWEVLLDAFEGGGGFLDGNYLWPYPREGQPDFAKRQSMARYHNYLETLVDLYVRFMFTQGVARTSKDEGYNEWLQDVDGAGTGIDDFLKKFAAVALVSGHAGCLVDKTADQPSGPTRAEDTGQVTCTVFTALSIMDWRHDRSSLAAVKLTEAAPATDVTVPLDPATSLRYLLWARDGWARFTQAGELESASMLDLGLVPLVVLRPKPSYLSQMLGRPLVSNANVVQALFNRASEEDQVIREQAFSVLTVQVDDDGDVETARQQLGSVIGSAKALVVRGQIKYETPDQAVPGTIRDNISYLVQEMYRSAHVRFKRDSLAAESGESIRLQYTELNEMLQGFSKALAQVERDIARAWFAWTAPTPELAEKAFEAAQCEAKYPTEFFLDALIGDLEAWAEAIRMQLGETMTVRIKQKAVRRIDPDIPPEVLEEIDAEIEELGDTSNPLMLAGAMPPPGAQLPPDDGDPEEQATRRAMRPPAEDDDDT